MSAARSSDRCNQRRSSALITAHGDQEPLDSYGTADGPMAGFFLIGPRLSARDCRRRKLSASRSALRGAAVISSPIALCKLPLRHAANTTGLMYDLRQTAGVLRSSAATFLTTAT